MMIERVQEIGCGHRFLSVIEYFMMLVFCSENNISKYPNSIAKPAIQILMSQFINNDKQNLQWRVN